MAHFCFRQGWASALFFVRLLLTPDPLKALVSGLNVGEGLKSRSKTALLISARS